MNKEKIFFRALLYLGVILLLALITSGLSQILVYFNKGASKADLLKTAEYLPDGLSPQITWLQDDEDTGRQMEEYTRSLITREYIRATHQRNLSHYTLSNSGLKEYFTVKAKRFIDSQVDNAMAMDVDVEHVELNHNFKLHFYAADGQLVSFTDYAVHRKSRVEIGDNNEVHYLDDVSDYLVVMQLIDGYWKIKNMERSMSTIPPTIKEYNIDTLGAAENRERCIHLLKQAKGINYYPQNSPFQEFWVKYDSSVIEKDFARIDSLGFNMVRIFINYEQFGKGDVVPEMLERLDHLMATASDNRLKVLLTLFDFNSNYHLFNFPNCESQLKAILSRYKKDPALVAYDLKNEVDLDFKYQDERDVREWLNFMLPKMRANDPFHPFTIGWSNPSFTNNYAEELDFLSFHSYADMDGIAPWLDRIKESNPNKLVLLSEFGMSSYESIIFPFGKTQTQQALHVGSIIDGLSKKGAVPFFLWTLYDYPEVSGSVAGGRPWQVGAQKHFGLYDSEGKEKEVLQVLNSQYEKPNYSIISKLPRFVFTYIIFGIIAMALFWLFLKRNKSSRNE